MGEESNMKHPPRRFEAPVSVAPRVPEAIKEEMQLRYLDVFAKALPFQPWELKLFDEIFGGRRGPDNKRPRLQNAYVYGGIGFLDKIAAYWLMSQDRHLNWQLINSHSLHHGWLREKREDYIDVTTPALIIQQPKSRVPLRYWDDLVAETLFTRYTMSKWVPDDLPSNAHNDAGILRTLFLDSYGAPDLIEDLKEYGFIIVNELELIQKGKIERKNRKSVVSEGPGRDPKAGVPTKVNTARPQERYITERARLNRE